MNPVPVSSISEQDVLFEKGLGVQKHRGNIYYRNMIEEKKSDYNSGGCRALKDMIAKLILQKLPGRCLTKHQDGNYYCLSEQEALIKIKQALRDCNRSRVTDKENKTKKARRKLSKNEQQDGSFDEKDMKRLLNLCMKL